MAITFEGSVEDLIAKVADSGIPGDWVDDGQGKHSFRSKKGGVLSFWPSKGTVLCQGKPEPKADLEAIFQVTGASAANELRIRKPLDVEGRKTQIFVVHGHDRLALEQLELVLRRLNLDPYILQNNDGESKTIIEALEQKIYRESAFGIVLMTPDDYG